jgi:type II secretory pathway component PulF
VDAGSPPSEVVSASGCFPQLFASQYATGELSGRLDETLRGLHRYYQEEGTRKLHNLAQWTPRLVYLFVVFMIAYHVVRFWMGHFAQISNVIGP